MKQAERKHEMSARELNFASDEVLQKCSEMYAQEYLKNAKVSL